MEKKNLMMIVVTGLLVVLAVVVGVRLWMHKSQTMESQELVSSMQADEAGINYGGNFDEFQYISEETSSEESDSEERQSADEKSERQENNSVVEKAESTFSGNENDVVSMPDEKELEERLIEQGEIIPDEEFNQIRPENSSNPGETNDDDDIPIFKSDGYEEYQVVCEAESYEEAEAIAAQISGTVLSCEYGIAVIQIKESVDSLLQRLEDQGSNLELYRNYKYSID